jgi:MFS family permease
VSRRLPPAITALGTYLEVLRLPGVARPAAGVAVASIPIGALGLAMLLLVEASTGRYAVAGLVVGALALGTGCGILAQGRLMDRLGQPRVLITAVAVQFPSLLVFVLALRAGGPPWLPALLAFAAGSCEPQVGGALRALWPGLTPVRLRQTAIAWSSVTLEVSALAGPLLLGAALGVIGAAGAVVGCAGCFAVGAVLLATSGPARSWHAGSRAEVGPLGALASPAVRLLTAVTAVVGAVGGLTQFSAAALANTFGAPHRATWLYAALSIGSLIGAVGYGARRWRGAPMRRLAVMLGCLCAATIGCAAAPGLAVLGLGLFCCGLLLGPLTVACFSLVAGHIPPGTEVGGFTTLTAASLAAGAAATATAGVVTEAAGPTATLLIAAAVAIAGVPIVLGPGGWTGRTDPVG